VVRPAKTAERTEVLFEVETLEGGKKRWRRGLMVNGVGLINEVNQHRAWLVLGRVTVFANR